jgi:type II secretion system protein C
MVVSIIKKYIWIINLVLIAGIAYNLAQIISEKIERKVEPSPSEAIASLNVSPEKKHRTKESRISTRSSYDIILKRNIFGLQNTLGLLAGNREEGLPQTTLNLELLATVITGKKSIAVIKNVDTGQARGYVEDEVIDIVKSENVRLSKIGSCIVVVERSEGPEKIKCKRNIDEEPASPTITPQIKTSTGFSRRERVIRTSRGTTEGEGIQENIQEGIQEIGEGEYVVDQKMLDELLSDPNELFTQARVIPQDDGLRFFGIRPNSVFFKIGLRNGDVIHKINDVELNNVENAFRLFEELKGQSQFSIDLTRRGQRLTYEYTVK